MESSNLFRMLSSSLPSPLPLVGFSALILLYVVILYLVVDLSTSDFSSPSRREENRFLGLSAEEIKGLPCFDCGVNFAAVCVVCLDGVQKGERCRIFPDCKHVFHARCIDLWLLRRLTCPICRSPIASLNVV